MSFLLIFQPTWLSQLLSLRTWSLPAHLQVVVAPSAWSSRSWGSRRKNPKGRGGATRERMVLTFNSTPPSPSVSPLCGPPSSPEDQWGFTFAELSDTGPSPLPVALSSPAQKACVVWAGDRSVAPGDLGGEKLLWPLQDLPPAGLAYVPCSLWPHWDRRQAGSFSYTSSSCLQWSGALEVNNACDTTTPGAPCTPNPCSKEAFPD